jgi:hypothetical protein
MLSGSRTVALLLTAAALATLATSAGAVDGLVLIDQNHALAGSVTPGDAPGFPVTISQAGSYRLASNLTVPAGVDAIQITANDVTIDLNGFSIIGPGVFPGMTGILGDGRTHIRIEHGSIIGFPAGLQFLGAAQYITLQKLHIDSLTFDAVDGINVGGVAAKVGRDKAAYAILRELQTSGQVQITCPSLVMDTVTDGTGVVELTVPYNGTGVSFPKNCKGENVLSG